MKILVIGTGAWATALSQVLLSHNDNEVTMYGINETQMEDLRIQKNTEFFGDYTLNYPYHRITNDLTILTREEFDYVLLAVPSEFSLLVLKDIVAKSAFPIKLINSTKGFINKSTDVISDFIKTDEYAKIIDYSCLLGPGFAQEVIKQEFTVVNILNKNLDNAKKVCNLFQNEFFIAKPNTYVKSAELVAAMKNPLAIVCGLLSGLNQSINVLSAFVTLGIKEIAELLKKLDLDINALNDYCGIGDIFLTCCSPKSRNFSFGLNLAKYHTAIEANKHYNRTVEGKDACKLVTGLFRKNNIKSVLFNNLQKVLDNEWNAIQFLKNTEIDFLKTK